MDFYKGKLSGKELDELPDKVKIAEEAASKAEDAATKSKEYLNELKTAISELPDGQAVSAQVVENTAKLTELNNKAVTSNDGDDSSDLDIADEQGNVLARFADGHHETKSFNSRNIGNPELFDESKTYAVGDYCTYGNLFYKFTSEHTGKWNAEDAEHITIIDYVRDMVSKSEHPVSIEEGDEAEFQIADEQGNVIMRLKDGHIQTKEFDSRNGGGGSYLDTASKVISKDLTSFTSGSISLDVPNLKNHYILGFTANVNTMGNLKIQFGTENNWTKGIVEVTPTSVIEYAYSTMATTTYTHGLTFTKNITILIKTIRVHFAELILLSGDNPSTVIFKKEISWNGCGSGCSITNNGGNYSNCSFFLNCDGLLKNIWIFGDSYTDMWTLKMDDIGFDNYLLDGFSGRTSQQALTSFNKDVKLATPTAVIWMMGMNDPDSGSINASWKSAFESVKATCKSKGIEFICCTIPCVPERNHSYKNAYIVNSGVRMIDIAKELGATTTGSSWYAGLLGNDKVHPSSSGSLRIALTLLKSMTFLQKK